MSNPSWIKEMDDAYRLGVHKKIIKNIFGMVKMNLVPLDYGDQHKLQTQALFLYDLLKERDPAANISHRELPPFWKHLEFINSRPYAVWNIIELDGGMQIGSVYLTRNDEIGLFITKLMQGCHHGRKALALFMDQNPRPKFYANVAPGNTKSQSFFHSAGFRCVQYTYQLEAECAE